MISVFLIWLSSANYLFEYALLIPQRSASCTIEQILRPFRAIAGSRDRRQFARSHRWLKRTGKAAPGVIDRPHRSGEIGLDVLIVVVASGDHRLDDTDFPSFELVATSSFHHDGKLTYELRGSKVIDSIRVLFVAVAAYSACLTSARADEEFIRNYTGQAAEWSTNNSGIAVAISLRHDSPVDIEVLERDIRTILSSQSPPIENEVFLDHRENHSVSNMSFFILGIERGPYGLDQSARGLFDAVQELRAIDAVD